MSEDRIAVGSVSGFAVLDKQGKILGVIGSRGKGPDQFDYVHGIAFGPDGSIYVADSYNNRLSAYEPNGKRRWIIRTGAPANSAQIDQQHAYVQGPERHRAARGRTPCSSRSGSRWMVRAEWSSSTCTTAAWRSSSPRPGSSSGSTATAGAEDGQFFYPVSVGYDPGRDWFTVADAFNRRVQIVRIPGSSSGVGGVAATFNRALASPWRACLFPLLLLLLAIVACRRRALPEASEETTRWRGRLPSRRCRPPDERCTARRRDARRSP